MAKTKKRKKPGKDKKRVRVVKKPPVITESLVCGQNYEGEQFIAD